MRCEEARQAISLALDGELALHGDDRGDVGEALEDHVRQCAGCSAFRQHALHIRSQLRVEGVDADALPDVVPAVLAAIDDEHTELAAVGDEDGEDGAPPGVGEGATEQAHAGDESPGPLARRRALRARSQSSPARGRRGPASPWARRGRPVSHRGWRIGAAVAAGFVLGATVVGLGSGGDDGRDVPTDVAGEATELEELGDVLLAWTPDELDPVVAEAARATPTVTALSAVAGASVDLVASRDDHGRAVDVPPSGWAIPLDTIAVDPAAHAPFAPLADQAAVRGLGDDEALLGRTSAEVRRLGPGSTIWLQGGQELSVTGVVDDAAIGGAELALTQATGRQLGVDQLRYLLLAHVGARTTVERSLRQAVPGGAPIRFRQPGETAFLRHSDAVLPPVLLKQRFGEFAYRPPAHGEREFEQELAWQAENLAERDIPRIGRMRCHQTVLDAVEGAVRELENRGLGDLLEPGGYRGCWNPRLVRPGGDLSHHAWGVGFDINYDPDTHSPDAAQDPRLVEVFARWGFTWGGEWLVDDPAHFEYVRPPATASTPPPPPPP